MNPLRGRDGHIMVAAEDGDTERCVRCNRRKEEHAPTRWSAHFMTVAGATRAEREALRNELAPNGQAWGR